MKTNLVSFAFLPVSKPVGPTSHDIVARIRRLVSRDVKVGHTGTLDPFASGVLILALGKATRFADEIHRLEKSYQATLRLGIRTDTLDPTGTPDLELPVPEFTGAVLQETARRFTGTMMQVPPVFSAKRVAGKKSYQLAREKQSVILAPKQITVFDLELTRTSSHTLNLEARCSTGTYIRVLGKDIAEALGCCGHLVQLERTGVGPVRINSCPSPEIITKDNLSEHLKPVSQLLPQFPELRITRQIHDFFIQGRPFPTTERFPQQFLAVYNKEDSIKSVFRCTYDEERQCIQSRILCYQGTS